MSGAPLPRHPMRPRKDAAGPASASRAERRGEIVTLPFLGDDEALLEALRTGSAAAVGAFCDRFAEHVLRVLARMLGSDSELEDLHHEVFVRALRGAAKVKDATSFPAWLTSIAVNVARSELKRRARRRWLTPLISSDEEPDAEAPTASDEDVEALRRTYALFDRLSVDLRIPLALRMIEGMELREIAEACDVSLATVKRRLTRAEERFTAMAQKDAVLAPWLERGQR